MVAAGMWGVRVCSSPLGQAPLTARCAPLRGFQLQPISSRKNGRGLHEIFVLQEPVLDERHQLQRHRRLHQLFAFAARARLPLQPPAQTLRGRLRTHLCAAGRLNPDRTSASMYRICHQCITGRACMAACA